MLHKPRRSSGINRPVLPPRGPRYIPDATATPVSAGPAAPAPDAPPVEASHDVEPLPSCPNGFVHTVQPGATLDRIAQRFGITLEALLAANSQIADPNLIFPGQHICVPFPSPPACPEGSLHTVQAGETMLVLTQQFGIALETLMAANPQVTDPNLIFPGQQICIPSTIH